MKDKLIQSASKEALSKNIETEIKSGKDPKQATAIAYSVQKANDAANAELLYCVIEFTESDYYGLTSRVGKQITLDAADTLIKNADTFHRGKNKPGYDKTYLDLYVQFNGHKYKVHLLRFDVGDGPQYMNVKEKANEVVRRIPELVSNSLYRNAVKQLDSAENSIKPGLYKHKNGQVYKSNEVLAQYELEKPNSDLATFIKSNYTKLEDDIQVTSENIRENIKYTMQSDSTPDLYFYIGEKYAMKEGSWTYGKYKLNGMSPEKLKADLKANGWHEVSKGPASFIDADKVSEQEKICTKKLSDYPVNARSDMKNSKDTEVEYLAQFSYANDIYHSAPTNLKAEAKMQLNKVLAELQSQFNLKRALQITDSKIKDKQVVGKYEKIVNGQPTFCSIIKHNEGFTVMCSEPKDDKDFNNLEKAKTYVEQKGYRKVSDKSIFTVKYKDRTFKVKAKDHKEAANKVYNKLSNQK